LTSRSAVEQLRPEHHISCQFARHFGNITKEADNVSAYSRKKEVKTMAKNEKTSPKVASKASKQLSSPKTGKAGKSVAGSALTQAPDKKKR
jgi:hypothetical protein